MMGWIVLAVSILLVLACFAHFHRRLQAYRFEENASLRRDGESHLVALVILLFAGAVIWYLISERFWAAPSPRVIERPVVAATSAPPAEELNVGATTLTDLDFADDDWAEDEYADEYVEPEGVEEDAIAEPPPGPTETLIEDSIIYFPLDSTLLVCEARSQLRLVAKFAASQDVIGIDLIGHTDTAGEATRNTRLSQERTEKVQRHLVSVLDVDPGLIRVVDWKGETSPVEITGDGVREQRNRRVEIVIEYVPQADADSSPIPSVWFERSFTDCPDSLSVPPKAR